MLSEWWEKDRLLSQGYFQQQKLGCGWTVIAVIFAWEDWDVSEMTCKYLSGWLNSLNANERCFSASFLISLTTGYTGIILYEKKMDR